MADKTAPEKDFIGALQKDTAGVLEKMVGKFGLSRKPKSFVELHERATELLLRAEERSLFGDDSPKETNKDLADMLVVMERLDQVATGGETADEVSVLSLIPDDIVITEKGSQVLVEAIGGKKINAEEAPGKKLPIEEALQLAKKVEQAEHPVVERKGGTGLSDKDKKIWESISREDRTKLRGMRRIIGVVGLDPDSIAKGVLGRKEYIYVDAQTGTEIKLGPDDRLAKLEPRYGELKLREAGSGNEFVPKKNDPKPKPFKGNIPEEWGEGAKHLDYFETTSGGKRVIFSMFRPITEEVTLISVKGKKVEAKRKEVIKSVLSEGAGLGSREIGLRQLLINISRDRAGSLADAYLTTLQRRGLRIGFKEIEDQRGIIIEGLGFGNDRYEALMRALETTGRYEKWRAIATLNEHNARFQMFFEAQNRKDAQKAIESDRLSQLASADNIAAWIKEIPDLAAALDWQEWQGLINPRTGEPLDYPAVVYGAGVEGALDQRLADGLVKEIVKIDGTSVKDATLANHQPADGDIFVLKSSDNENKSVTLINILKNRALFYGVGDYVVDLAFAFHRFMFTGLDRGRSYHKAQTVGDYKVIADILGLGTSLEEDYAHLSTQDKADFEKLLQQMSIYQTGVKSFFQMVLGYRDQNPQNRDRWYREAWGDRAPLYRDPPEWFKDRIEWADKVDWGQEVARRDIYRWMGEFFYTVGKGMQDVGGRFAGRETPFNPANQHHRRALIDHLLKSNEARMLLTRAGFDMATLTQPRLGELIDQIFPEGRPPKSPEENNINFLSELTRFNQLMGYQGGLEAAATDFEEVADEFQDAVRLEKVLENPAVFDNLLKFTGEDGWSPNQQLVDKIHGFGGVVNEGSYDQHVYYMLYWYATYLVVAENFAQLRLHKKETGAGKLQDALLGAWQDQSTRDVRGTRPSFAFHILNEINEGFLIGDIEKEALAFANQQEEIIRRDLDPTAREKAHKEAFVTLQGAIARKEIGHAALEKAHEEERLWRDAVLFYQEPELDPAAHEKMVQEYCRQRMLRLHRRTDEVFIDLLRRKAVGLQDIKGLVDPDGNVQMFRYAVLTEDGRLVGPGEDGGRDSDEYSRSYKEAVARFYKEASDLAHGSKLYELNWASSWGDKQARESETMDAQGLYKFDIMEVWYGVLENDIELYPQLLSWYKQLKELPKEAWDKKEGEDRYSRVPDILVGFAREYFEDGQGRSIDLRADTPEAESYRVFFKRWLYFEDKGGYRISEGFDPAFRSLIALMFAIEVGGRGIPDDPSKGPSVSPMRYLLYDGVYKDLLKNSDKQSTIEKYLGFYDILMRQARVGGESWAEFFEANNVGFLAKKETIVEQIASLIDRDKMFSPKYDDFAEQIQAWFGLSKRPDARDFSMAEQVAERLESLINQNLLNEPEAIMTDVTSQITSGQIRGNIKDVSRYLAINHGLKILPWHYGFTRLLRPDWLPVAIRNRLPAWLRPITPADVGNILRNKLPLERRARRWVYKNYGIDIGNHPNMPAVFRAIDRRVPVKWRDDDSRRANSYLRTLGNARRSFGIRGAFGWDRWLDETFFNRPNRDQAQANISSLHDALVMGTAKKYFGVFKQHITTAQESRWYYALRLTAGQIAMSLQEKVKLREELRSFIPFGQYSWELLDRADVELFGLSRPTDTLTDIMLTLEYVPIPLLSLIPSILSAIPQLKGIMQLPDIWTKKYLDAPLGAFLPAAASVVLPAALWMGGTLGPGLALGIALAGYELSNFVFRRWVMPTVNKNLEHRGLIERHPQDVFLMHKGIVK